MEIIKKTILQALTTGTTTGCTGTCRIIIPDLTAVYNFKICLVQETQDLGIFNIYYSFIVDTVNSVYDERGNSLKFIGVLVENTLPVKQLGFLFTTDSIYGNEDNLIYDNYPSKINKLIVSNNNIEAPYNYELIFNNVQENVKYYYRAFSINENNITYGSVKNITTSNR